VLVGQQQQWECWLSADCKQYAVKITFQCSLVKMNVVQLLLVVVKCVKCRVGLLFWYRTVCNNMYCWVLSCYCIYICKHLVSTNSTLCKAAVCCNHSHWMLYQQSCTCTQSHSYCNGTANCTVGHDCEALLFLGQNAVNFVKKTTVPFHVPHRIQTKYIVCAA